jgi:hypothetical protein
MSPCDEGARGICCEHARGPSATATNTNTYNPKIALILTMVGVALFTAAFLAMLLFTDANSSQLFRVRLRDSSYTKVRS